MQTNSGGNHLNLLLTKVIDRMITATSMNQNNKIQKQSSRQMFYKIDVLKNITKFTGKHLCQWCLFFI